MSDYDKIVKMPPKNRKKVTLCIKKISKGRLPKYVPDYILYKNINIMLFLELLIKKSLIYKKDEKYYSNCAINEEITIELKEIIEEIE